MKKIQKNSLYGQLGNPPAMCFDVESQVTTPTLDMICNMSWVPVKGYKIVDLKNDNYQWLFHGVNGTKVVPFNTWVKADRKWAGEGGHKYWTGFHMFVRKEIAEKYFERFTDKTKTRVIIRVFGRRMRVKESSRGNVFLAEELWVPSQGQPV